MFAAAPWYDSGAWPAVGGITALIGVPLSFVSVSITYLVYTSRRTLTYSMPVSYPLLPAWPGMSSGLRVFHNGRALKDPHVYEIYLAVHGRKDIPSSAFDQGKPICLDIGVPIATLLEVTHDPATAPIPKAQARNRCIEVSPGLIRKRQTMSFTVLADGPDARLNCKSSLVDVRVKRQQEYDNRRGMFQRVLMWTIVILVAVWILSDPSAAGKVVNQWVNGLTSFINSL